MVFLLVGILGLEGRQTAQGAKQKLWEGGGL